MRLPSGALLLFAEGVLLAGQGYMLVAQGCLLAVQGILPAFSPNNGAVTAGSGLLIVLFTQQLLEL